MRRDAIQEHGGLAGTKEDEGGYHRVFLTGRTGLFVQEELLQGSTAAVILLRLLLL